MVNERINAYDLWRNLLCFSKAVIYVTVQKIWKTIFLLVLKLVSLTYCNPISILKEHRCNKTLHDKQYQSYCVLGKGVHLSDPVYLLSSKLHKPTFLSPMTFFSFLSIEPSRGVRFILLHVVVEAFFLVVTSVHQCVKLGMDLSFEASFDRYRLWGFYMRF